MRELPWSAGAALCLALAAGGCDDGVHETPVAPTTPALSASAFTQACTSPGAYPAPDAFPALAGPGLGRTRFASTALFKNCAFLDGGALDVLDHHNAVYMRDGFLLMPWSPETGKGGISLFDMSDPCHPQRVATGNSNDMRESHTIGFSDLNGKWAVTSALKPGTSAGGVLFWDMANPMTPTAVKRVDLPGHKYPDAYKRVVLSTFWQPPYVYAGFGDNGVAIIDALDPRAPSLVKVYKPQPTFRVGQVQAIGNLLIVTAAEGARTLLLDISNPTAPQPIPGGSFNAVDRGNQARDAYFTNSAGGFVWYARKESGGGFMAMDIRDPEHPRFAGDFRSEGEGGYVSVEEPYLFVGNSKTAEIYDVSDVAHASKLATLDMTGDLDTIVALGNLVVLSVDDGAETNKASAIAPWRSEPDAVAPRVTWAWPKDGATGIARGSRFGVTLSEIVDSRTAWEGSVRLYRSGVAPELGRVPVTISVQDLVVSVVPLCKLEPNTEYTLELPAGGLRDASGNAIAQGFSASFRTGSQ
jgi:hypothetical protein